METSTVTDENAVATTAQLESGAKATAQQREQKAERKPLSSVTNTAISSNQTIATDIGAHLLRRRPPIPFGTGDDGCLKLNKSENVNASSSSSGGAESVASSVASTARISVDKIPLHPNFFTQKTWMRYYEQMADAHHSASTVWDGPYAIMPWSQFSAPYDLILKVWYHRSGADASKYFKVYCVHQAHATHGRFSSEVLENVLQKRPNTLDIDIQVQDICADSMRHAIVYMYSGHVTVAHSELIPLYTLVERLKMKGDIKRELLASIEKQLQKNEGASVLSYLLQAQSLAADDVQQLIFRFIASAITARKHSASKFDWHRLSLSAFQQLFTHCSALCSEQPHAPYFMVIEFVRQLTPTNVAKVAFATVVKMPQFDVSHCTVTQSMEFLKLMDAFYAGKADCSAFYRQCMEKAQFEFCPFQSDVGDALSALGLHTFNEIVVNALHLQKSSIEVALMKYGESNQHKTDELKGFDYTTIRNQRVQIYGTELSDLFQNKLVGAATKKLGKLKLSSSSLIPADDPIMTNYKSSSSSSASSTSAVSLHHHKSSPSPTPLSGTLTEHNLSSLCLPLAAANCMMDDLPSPPLLITPHSPPKKTQSEWLSPMARRVPPSPPPLSKNASNASLLEPMPSPNRTNEILDVAIASIERENLHFQRADSMGDDSENDERTPYASPQSSNDRARNTFSYKRSAEAENAAKATIPRRMVLSTNAAAIPPRKAHLISPDFTPEKLVFRSRPTSPQSSMQSLHQQQQTGGGAYRAPKLNKGCLVETIENFYPCVAKLTPTKSEHASGRGGGISGNVLESRVYRKPTFGELAPRKRVQYSNVMAGALGGAVEHSGVAQATPFPHVGGGGSGSNNSSPSKRRGSGGAYCVECHQWRHKFDFTKSQWRNRPRGFRRCKHCTGEIGSDSKPSTNEWSPRRYRQKQSQNEQ